MKIHSITLNQNSRYKLNNNTNKVSIASPKKQPENQPKNQTENQFLSCQKILFPQDEVSFSRNPAKNLCTTASSLKKAIEKNDIERTTKILSSFSQQNGGFKGIKEKYQDKFQPTVSLIGPRRYDLKYPIDNESDLFVNKNCMAFRKGKQVVEFNFKNETSKVFIEPRFMAYDFMKSLERKFKNGENDECAEDLRNFYIKNPKFRNKTISTDNGILKTSKNGKIGAYFQKDNNTQSSILVKLNKRNKIAAYTTNNSKPDGFNCIKTFSYNYPISF